ncbi:MAG: GNAT family N-acetyltransferase [Candidatus Xenobiia bacterium LiM19]
MKNNEKINHLFQIETERLRLIPLDLFHLILCRESRSVMEKNLGLTVTLVVMDTAAESAVKDALEAMIDLVRSDEEAYLWNTNWEIVEKSANRIIGGLCFHGPPDFNGEVQIGYVLQRDYQRKGYMTEALRYLLFWVFTQSGVKAVTAEVKKDNIASCRVLQRIGMKRVTETEDTYWWKAKKSDIKEHSRFM